MRGLVAPDMLEQLDLHLATLPDNLRPGLRRYLVEGLPTGGFLQAVIAGDLYDAVQRADPFCAVRIADVVRFFVYFAPADSYGSREAYAAWVERGKEARRATDRRE